MNTDYGLIRCCRSFELILPAIVKTNYNKYFYTRALMSAQIQTL
jgi:hypothetical protein